MLHVFDRSCNLISTDGGLISLVTRQVGEGPFNLVLPPTRFSSLATAETEVEHQNGMLRVGSFVVDTTGAKLWDPRPAWGLLRHESGRIRARVPLLTEVLRSSAPPGGLAELILSQPDSTTPAERGLFRPSRASIDKLLEGLRRSDMDLCEEATVELAGCGIGLTPEGDDFILGCLLAVRTVLEDEVADRLAQHIFETAAQRTTLLSAEWLRSAARGECARPWHDLFESLLQDRVDKIEAAAVAVLQQGHTSGSAALAGFTAVMESIL